uniref:Uncharacterized protein n=1 Tax=Arundo donax TaxID=35708 RepID=A0A0A9D522_ARUDO
MTHGRRRRSSSSPTVERAGSRPCYFGRWCLLVVLHLGPNGGHRLHGHRRDCCPPLAASPRRSEMATVLTTVATPVPTFPPQVHFFSLSNS